MSRLVEALTGKESNHIFPFCWMDGTNYELIPKQLEEIKASGAKGFCIESRTHDDFGGETWWRDIKRVLEEATRLDLKVMLLDDKHFPTGYANNIIVTENLVSEKKRTLVKRCIDVAGPMKGATMYMLRKPPKNCDSEVFGVWAYKRKDGVFREEFEGEGIDLSAYYKDGIINWDIPAGCYRIFVVYLTYGGSFRSQENYVNVLRPSSGELQIKAVYQPFYDHFKEYFGNTFIGFFTDEPLFGNGTFGEVQYNPGFFDYKIGTTNMAIPWDDEVRVRMEKKLGYDPIPYICGLWFKNVNSPELRHAYMDTVTELYSENFSQAIGKWCHEHGVIYTGHVIEDNNASTGLGHSIGHYFRSMKGQDISGVDVIFQQVMPGFGHYDNIYLGATELSDSEFFHYVEPFLGSSCAHLYPEMKNRALCEVFGGYGWSTGSQTMKWIMDFMMVRGINVFVPHAFAPNFENDDAPPHFGSFGQDPQFDGFSALLNYTNKVCHVLQGNHVANAAVLYQAEAEWMDLNDFMKTQAVCYPLYDNHICYEIVSSDMILDDNTGVRENKLQINYSLFDVLFIPYAKYLPEKLLARLKVLSDSGVDVLFIDKLPCNCEYEFNTISLQDIAPYMISNGYYDIIVPQGDPLLRFYHVTEDRYDRYMFFNESIEKTADTNVVLPNSGYYYRVDFHSGSVSKEYTENGQVQLSIEPFRSELILFGENDTELEKYINENGNLKISESKELKLQYRISIAEPNENREFVFLRNTDELVNFSSFDQLPDFSGYFKYESEFDIEGEIPSYLDLGVVGQNCSVKINGIDLGMRICPPYRYRVRDVLKKGRNNIEIVVANTNASRKKIDKFSYYNQICSSGLVGPVKLIY